MTNIYTFSVDLAAVEHLGLNLYSNTAAALTELIANAWDADATKVHITIPEDKTKIEIVDNGHGMSVSDLNHKFLKVAYKRRVNSPTSPRGRPVMGRKGIGKLALFSIAEHVDITSKQVNSEPHSLSIDVEQLKNHIQTGTAYHPISIIGMPFEQNSGTRFILTSLLSSRINQSILAMKKRLARRFSIIGEGDDFNVYVNGEKVSHKDRDDFRALQFAWKFSNDDDLLFPKSVRVFDFNSNTFTYDGICYEFKGWIGTAFKPSDLNTTDMGNLNGISVISRGRIFQENILDEISENRLMKAYITGVIQADFLDDNISEDIATSDRQRLREDDARYKALTIFIKNLIDEMYKIWSSERKKYDKEEVIKIYPQIKEWLEELPTGHRKQAEELLSTVSNLRIDDEKEASRKELYRSTILAFERLKLDGSSSELSGALQGSTSELIKLLASYDTYEISLYHDIVKARINAIKLLQKKIDENEYENPIRDFIFEHLWLIDPTWERITGTELREQSVHTAFGKEFGAELTDTEKGRVDLRYRNIGDEHIIVELKRYKRNDFTPSELYEQGKKYRNGLFKILNRLNSQTANKDRIRVVFLIGERFDDMDEDESETYFSAINAVVVTYDETILKAKAAYADFLVKTQELDKTRKLVDSFV